MKQKLSNTVAIFLFGAALGLAVGRLYFGRPRAWFGAYGEWFLLERYAELQYTQATYPEAERALRAYLAYLDKQERVTVEPRAQEEQWLYPPQVLKSEKALAWTRLALLHERNNNFAAAEEAWRNAESFAATLGWNETNRARLRDFITRRESRCSSSRPTQSK